MRNLLEFQAPIDGEVTLCEVDGRVHSMNYEYANVNVFTNTVRLFVPKGISRLYNIAWIIGRRLSAHSYHEGFVVSD